EITFHARFHKYWHHEGVLGEGGDGIVHLYQQGKRQGMFIAVKLPRYYSARKDLAQEIKNMRTIGQHKHILDLCHATEDWYPHGPALFLPVCELGNLVDYRESWCAKQGWEGKPERVSEITMWKLFRDMVLALNYLHHELGTRYVHNDFKPQNILAVKPPDHIEGQALPEEPIFKLSDFARLTPWPTPKGQHPQGFDGTPEYAPP
ncbi:kinase-like protein, partial [Macroventuria anomochaeta]